MAVALETMELKTHVKAAKVESKKDVAEDPFVVDNRKLSASPKSISEEQVDDFEELRKKYVGDVPESQEPLLIESKRRFVLYSRLRGRMSEDTMRWGQ